MQSCSRCALRTLRAFAPFCTLQMLVGLQVDSAKTNVPHCRPSACCHPARQFACGWQSYQPTHVSQMLGLQHMAQLPCTCAPCCWATCRWQSSGMSGSVLIWHMVPSSSKVPMCVNWASGTWQRHHAPMHQRFPAARIWLIHKRKPISGCTGTGLAADTAAGTGPCAGGGAVRRLSPAAHAQVPAQLYQTSLLIDHLSDLVKPADSEGRSTNFQVGVNRAAWCGIHLWGCALRAAVHSVRAMLWLETGLPLV